jgi:hypothetical protein
MGSAGNIGTWWAMITCALLVSIFRNAIRSDRDPLGVIGFIFLGLREPYAFDSVPLSYEVPLLLSISASGRVDMTLQPDLDSGDRVLRGHDNLREFCCTGSLLHCFFIPIILCTAVPWYARHRRICGRPLSFHYSIMFSVQMSSTGHAGRLIYSEAPRPVSEGQGDSRRCHAEWKQYVSMKRHPASVSQAYISKFDENHEVDIVLFKVWRCYERLRGQQCDNWGGMP